MTRAGWHPPSGPAELQRHGGRKARVLADVVDARDRPFPRESARNPNTSRHSFARLQERFDLEDIASRLPGSAPKADAPEDSISAADAGDIAEPEQAEITEEAVEERDLSPRAEFARDLGAAADGSGDEDEEVSATAVAASGRSWGDDAAPPREPDQDEWASLIRRMLAVYRQNRAVE